MNVSEVVDDDYKEIARIGSPVTVGQNPQAVHVSPDGKTVFIYAALDFEVGFYDASTMRRLGKMKVCEPPKSPEWVRGKLLFSTSRPPMTARRWVACSSCHPSGAGRWPGLAPARRSAQDASRCSAAHAHASAALVRRPRRSAGFRVHHSLDADAGPRPLQRPDQAERGCSRRRNWNKTWPASRRISTRWRSTPIRLISVCRRIFRSPPGKLSEAGLAERRQVACSSSDEVGCAKCSAAAGRITPTAV